MLPSFASAGNRLTLALAALRGPGAPTPQPAPPTPDIPLLRPDLARLAQPGAALPAFVAHDAVSHKYLDLLGPLDWAHFPERPANHPWPGPTPAPRAPYVAAYLIKLNEGLHSMGKLRRYLLEHPALVWCLGFPLRADPTTPCGFDVARSLPTRRQFGRVLRELDNASAQFLLRGTVHLLTTALPPELQAAFGDVIALDTKHIIAWVKENNPKAYVDNRYDKTQQPKGDPDCKLGCKRRHNQGEGDAGSAADTTATPAAAATQPAVPPPNTPTTNPVPARQAEVGEYYWGYASGVITTKVPDWGEFVLAELTQPFDRGDATYFFPLLARTERCLGRRPRYGALDKAYDAFYVYQYFHDAGGFAAVPFSEKGGRQSRSFSPEGLPLCAAGLPMPLKFTFTDRTSTLVVHERGKYVCPLRGGKTPPAATAPAVPACPVQHERWAHGGCTAMMPTCIGARLRYQLDRTSPTYKAIYKQRTADERVNSQAVELGIEHPRLRRQSAIVNQNTLIYVLINLRALQRVRHHQEELARQPKLPTTSGA
jgi:hypothetical protein